MHDPLHVVGELRRPPLTKRERAGREVTERYQADPKRRMRYFGPIIVRPRIANCYGCDENGKATKTYESLGIYEGESCKDCAGRGYYVIPHRRRPFFSPFFRWNGREWFFPPVVTLWHRDPEVRGDDSSCSRPYRQKEREAHKDGRWLQKAWWRWCSSHYGWWHVQHYHVQVIPVQGLRRWLFTRCVGCGQRMPFGCSPISSHWDSPPREHWWSSEVGLWHHDCYSKHCEKRKAEAAA